MINWLKKIFRKEEIVEIVREATKLFDVNGNHLFIGDELLANDTYIFFKGKLIVSKYGEYYLVNKLKDCVVVTRSTTLYSKEDFENVKSSIIVEGKSVERKEVKTVVEIAEKVRRAKLNTLVLNNLGKANYVIVFEDIETLKAQYEKISYFIKKHYRANWDERNNAGVDVCEFYLNDTRIQFVLNGFHAVGPCVVMQYKELV